MAKPEFDNSIEEMTLNSTEVLQTTVRSPVSQIVAIVSLVFTSIAVIANAVHGSSRPTVAAEVAGTVDMIVSTIAVIANAVVLLVLVRARRQFGSSVHTLIANQSAMDLFTCLSAVPFYIMVTAHWFNYNGNQILDGTMCVLFDGLALAGLGLTADKIGLVVITLERYFKIVHAGL